MNYVESNQQYGTVHASEMYKIFNPIKYELEIEFQLNLTLCTIL